MDYVDFEINIMSESSAVVKFGGSEYSDKPRLDGHVRGELFKKYPDSKAYGALLFQSIFPQGSETLEGYSDSLAIARMQRKRLRFKLKIDLNAPAELNQMDWELLYDTKNDIALARSQITAFSRDINVRHQRTTPEAPARLRMLVVLSCPTNLAEYDLPDCPKDQILARLKDILGQLSRVFDVNFLERTATPEAIRKELTASHYDVIHIQAHGVLRAKQGASQLVLEDEEGKANFVDEAFLREILESDTPPSLTTLVACHSADHSRLQDPFSGLALALVKHGTPAVVAMSRSIGVATAEHFIRSFYSNLASTGTLDESMNEARKQVYLNDRRSNEWSVPVLYMRLTDGKVLTPRVEQVSVSHENMQDEGLWKGLLQQLSSSNLIPVVGPELNRGLLLSGPAIAKQWSELYEYHKFNYPYIDRNDLPRIAKYVEIKNGLNFPHTELLGLLKQDVLEREKLRDRESFRNTSLEEVIGKVSWRYFDRDPELPHVMLAKLPLHTVVTTNFDSFLREAFLRERPKKPRVELCRWRGNAVDNPEYQAVRGSVNEPLLFHAFGYESDPTSMVLTDDDYLDFIRRVTEDSWRVPRQLRSDLVVSELLFLGYDVRDVDFRVLFKSVVAQLREMQKDRVIVVQIDPTAQYRQKLDELEQLRQMIRNDATRLNLIVHWSNLRTFIGELWQRWKKQK